MSLMDQFARFAVLLLAIVGPVSSAVVRTLGLRDDNLPARVPYVFPAAGTDPVADTIRSRRTNGTLLDLDGVLLNAPFIAAGWSSFAGAIRDNNSLPGNMRELFILRTAVLNSATYQWLQHESVGRSEGLTTQQLQVLRFSPAFVQTPDTKRILGPSLSAAMEFTDWITKNVKVPSNVFVELNKFLNEQQMVEAAATASGYNMVSRFVVSLNVDDKMDDTVPTPT